MTTPEGLDPSIRSRKIAGDEGPGLGGLGSAPTPLMYFSAASRSD